MAQEDIAAMQAAWEQEKTVLQQQAYEEGFQIGYEEGRNKSLSDMNESVKTANEVTVQIEGKCPEILGRAGKGHIGNCDEDG